MNDSMHTDGTEGERSNESRMRQTLTLAAAVAMLGMSIGADVQELLAAGPGGETAQSKLDQAKLDQYKLDQYKLDQYKAGLETGQSKRSARPSKKMPPNQAQGGITVR